MPNDYSGYYERKALHERFGSWYGIILDIWKNDPVFHGFSPERSRIGAAEFTRCGREISSYKPWLPIEHVVKFARPCKGCFPQEG